MDRCTIHETALQYKSFGPHLLPDIALCAFDNLFRSPKCLRFSLLHSRMILLWRFRLKMQGLGCAPLPKPERPMFRSSQGSGRYGFRLIHETTGSRAEACSDLLAGQDSARPKHDTSASESNGTRREYHQSSSTTYTKQVTGYKLQVRGNNAF